MAEPRIGELNTCGTLWYDAAAATAVDDLGEHVANWTSLGSVWCGLKALAGANRWLAQQSQPDVTYEVQFRYGGRATYLLSSNCKLTVGGRTIYLGPGRDQDGRRKWIKCDGAERPAN